jgi:hypothetical protein
LSNFKVYGTSNIKVKICLRFEGTSKGESNNLIFTDIEALRYGDQTGLGTLVVHTINDECFIFIKK